MKGISILFKGRSQLETLYCINLTLFNFLGLWGALSPRMDSFVYTRSDLVMPRNGHLEPKLDSCKKPFLISRPNFGYKLLDSCSNTALFDPTWASLRLDLTEHWQFTQHPSYFETQNSVMKIFYIVQRVIPIVDCWFCRGSAQDCFWIWGVVGGTYPPRWTILSQNTQSDLVMPLTGYLWPKLGCCTKSFPISGPNFG